MTVEKESKQMANGENFKTEIYREICCEECNEIIHNHFKCPVCGNGYAGTSILHRIGLGEDEIECESCSSIFEILSYDGCCYAEIKLIEKGEK